MYQYLIELKDEAIDFVHIYHVKFEMFSKFCLECTVNCVVIPKIV